jgi:hypothetical protein
VGTSAGQRGQLRNSFEGPLETLCHTAGLICADTIPSDMKDYKSNMYRRAYMNACIQAFTPIHHACVYTRKYSRTHSHTQARSYECGYSRPHTCLHLQSYIRRLFCIRCVNNTRRYKVLMANVFTQNSAEITYLCEHYSGYSRYTWGYLKKA